jgi:hypothetical protein
MGFILIIVLLSACSPAVITTVQPTRSPQPTITPTVITMDQNVEAILNGELEDVNNLSVEERKEFSIILAQKMNEARGARPLIYNNEAYVDPVTGMMKDYDGHADLSETIQMYLAASLDSEGNLLIQNEEGTWVKINGSKDVDWNMVVTDPDDERIDWPTGNESRGNGFSPPSSFVYLGGNIIPMVLLDNNVSQLYIGGENAAMQPTLTFLDIKTDNYNNPILARKVITHSTSFILCEEGSDDNCVEYSSLNSFFQSFKEIKNSQFYKSFLEGQVYYVGVSAPQEMVYDAAYITQLSEYENVVDVPDVWSVLTDTMKNDDDMLVLAARLAIKKN